jgi:glycosyltransferase involved in cell wall biosynthesis
MVEELVSIITPCYNGTSYIDKLLDSVLIQDYPNIELIIVDDGSSDDLLGFLQHNRYFDKFDKKGFFLYYFYQENQGQSVAINLGLSHYNGKYITWPDSDDYYKSSSVISTFVESLKKNNIEIVRCYPTHVSEDGREWTTFGTLEALDKEVFFDCLLETNFWFSPICYFFKAELLKRVLDNTIINSKVGQNFQLYLPTFFYGRLMTIKSELIYYLVRENSHSHSKRSIEDAVNRLLDIFQLKILLIDRYHLEIANSVLERLKRQKNNAVMSLLVDNKRFMDVFSYAIQERYLSFYILKRIAKRIFLRGQ